MQPSDVSKWSNGIDLMLYERHGQIIFTYIYRQVACLQDAEDLMVEVFLAAFKQDCLTGLTVEQQVAWLRRVARNKVVDWYRRRHSHIKTVPLEEALDAIEEELTPEQHTVQREAYERLYRSLDHLSPIQQQVIRLRFGDNLRFSEIAEIVHRSEPSVRKLLTRTLRRLRSIYEQH